MVEVMAIPEVQEGLEVPEDLAEVLEATVAPEVPEALGEAATPAPRPEHPPPTRQVSNCPTGREPSAVEEVQASDPRDLSGTAEASPTARVKVKEDLGVEVNQDGIRVSVVSLVATKEDPSTRSLHLTEPVLGSEETLGNTETFKNLDF